MAGEIHGSSPEASGAETIAARPIVTLARDIKTDLAERQEEVAVLLTRGLPSLTVDANCRLSL
jgi:hypothetical protein